MTPGSLVGTCVDEYGTSRQQALYQREYKAPSFAMRCMDVPLPVTRDLYPVGYRILSIPPLLLHFIRQSNRAKLTTFSCFNDATPLNLGPSLFISSEMLKFYSPSKPLKLRPPNADSPSSATIYETLHGAMSSTPTSISHLCNHSCEESHICTT